MLKIIKYDFLHGWNGVKKLMIVGLLLAVLDGITMLAAGGHVVISPVMFGILGEDKGMTWWIIALNVCFFAVLMALFCITIERIFHNLWRKMFGKEGILTHTLPMEQWELLLGKALGTWLFGEMMLIYAAACVLVVMAVAATGTMSLPEFADMIWQALPQLELYHIMRLARGILYVLFGIGLQMSISFMMIICLQFVCIAARQFGKYALASGIIMAVLIHHLSLQGIWILAVLAILSWFGSMVLLKKRLSLT